MRWQEGMGTMQKWAFTLTTMTRDTIVKIRLREILYRTTESVKRQPVMTYVALISKTCLKQKCNQTCLEGLIK